MSWNINRTLNKLSFDVSNLQEKTTDIVETNENGTPFDKKLYCDGIVINDYVQSYY